MHVKMQNRLAQHKIGLPSNYSISTPRPWQTGSVFSDNKEGELDTIVERLSLSLLEVLVERA